MAGATLYTSPSSWRAYLVLIAAQYGNFPLKLASGAPEFHPETGEVTEHFPSLFPVGQVPVLVDDGGFHVSGSNAAAFYVSSRVLRGSSGQQSSLVQQWVNFTESELVSPAATWVLTSLGLRQASQSETKRARADVQRVLSLLNGHLEGRSYLVGECLTLADVTLVCALLELYRLVLSPSLREQYTNASRWFNQCAGQAEFRRVLGEMEPCLPAGPATGTLQPEANFAIEVLAPAKTDRSPPRQTTVTEVGAKEEPGVEDKAKALPDVVMVGETQTRLRGQQAANPTQGEPGVRRAADSDGQSLPLIEFDTEVDGSEDTPRVDSPEEEEEEEEGEREGVTEPTADARLDAGLAKPLVSVKLRAACSVQVIEERGSTATDSNEGTLTGAVELEAEGTQGKGEGVEAGEEGEEVMEVKALGEERVEVGEEGAKVGGEKEERAEVKEVGEERAVAKVEEETGMEASKESETEVTEEREGMAEVPVEILVTLADIQEERVGEVCDGAEEVLEVMGPQEPTGAEGEGWSMQPRPSLEDPGPPAIAGGLAKELAEVTRVDDGSSGKASPFGPPREEMPTQDLPEGQDETNGGTEARAGSE